MVSICHAGTRYINDVIIQQSHILENINDCTHSHKQTFHHLAAYYHTDCLKFKHNRCIESIIHNDNIDTITYEWMRYNYEYMENIWQNVSEMLRNEQYTWKLIHSYIRLTEM